MQVSPLSKLSRSIRRNLLLFLLMAIPIVVLNARAQESVSPAEASFQDRLRPIVFKNCQGCHTFGGHAGGLRLDSFDSLLKGGDRGPVIVPADPQASLLLTVVRREDPQLQMPPSKKLQDDDIALIEQWIKAIAQPS